MDRRNSILVVDDEPNGFDVIEAHLYREGYELTYASSGAEALNCLDTIEPDVILLDVMMPEMDGMELCRRIKSDRRWKHIPIVMVTALNSKEDLARSFDAGADDFLTKPISGIELRARVRSMLRIKHQYDALQEMIALREDLSNMIVHDLRNPLTRILAESHFLSESDLTEEDIESIELISSAGRQLNSMINDLLIQAKMESGKMVLNRAEANLNQIVEESLLEFKSVAVSKNLQLKSQITENSLIVSVDASLIRRVIDNLLSNAYKFSPKDGTITIAVDSLEEDGLGMANGEWVQPKVPTPNSQSPKKVRIQVADEGFGIEEELKQSIFQKYEVGKVMKGVSQLGLGLAFCKMVIDAHGGTIFVDNQNPQGAIFTVIL